MSIENIYLEYIERYSDKKYLFSKSPKYIIVYEKLEKSTIIDPDDIFDKGKCTYKIKKALVKDIIDITHIGKDKLSFQLRRLKGGSCKELVKMNTYKKGDIIEIDLNWIFIYKDPLVPFYKVALSCIGRNKINYTGTLKLYHDNGQINKTQQYNNNKRQGTYEVFNISGIKVKEGHYENDKVHGILKTYHNKTRTLLSVVNYMDDKKQGISYMYYDSGELNIECTYLNDALVGKYREWYESGKIKEYREYNNGQCLVHIRYSEDGEILDNDDDE